MRRGLLLLLWIVTALFVDVAGRAQERPNGFFLTSPLSLSSGYDDNFLVGAQSTIHHNFGGGLSKIAPDGNVTTLAGAAGQSGSDDGVGGSARFTGPAGLALDTSGNLYVGEILGGAIRKIAPGALVSTVARGFSGLNGLALDFKPATEREG